MHDRCSTVLVLEGRTLDAEENLSNPLSSEEEEQVREEARKRLLAENEHRNAGNGIAPNGVDVHAELRRAHRLRVMREEEDAFYAERGLFRYRNHRGETEWLTQDEIAKRKANHRRKRSSLIRRLQRQLPSGEFFGFLAVIGLLVAGFLYFRDGRAPAFRTALEIRVMSNPQGAAVFLDGVSANATTDAILPVRKAGPHVISVARPGFRAVPSSVIVNLTEGSPQGLATFTLYPVRSDTTNGMAE